MGSSISVNYEVKHESPASPSIIEKTRKSPPPIEDHSTCGVAIRPLLELMETDQLMCAKIKVNYHQQFVDFTVAGTLIILEDRITRKYMDVDMSQYKHYFLNATQFNTVFRRFNADYDPQLSIRRQSRTFNPLQPQSYLTETEYPLWIHITIEPTNRHMDISCDGVDFYGRELNLLIKCLHPQSIQRVKRSIYPQLIKGKVGTHQFDRTIKSIEAFDCTADCDMCSHVLHLEFTDGNLIKPLTQLYRLTCQEIIDLGYLPYLFFNPSIKAKQLSNCQLVQALLHYHGGAQAD